MLLTCNIRILKCIQVHYILKFNRDHVMVKAFHDVVMVEVSQTLNEHHNVATYVHDVKAV